MNDFPPVEVEMNDLSQLRRVEFVRADAADFVADVVRCSAVVVLDKAGGTVQSFFCWIQCLTSLISKQPDKCH